MKGNEFRVVRVQTSSSDHFSDNIRDTYLLSYFAAKQPTCSPWT